MKTKITFLLSISIALLQWANAQTYILNWNSSFSSPWAAGGTSGSASNIGGSGVNATVLLTSPEGTAMSALTDFTSPQVSSAGNPFSTELGADVPNLAVGMDLNAKTSYVDIVINFSGYSVSNVKFNIADIDEALVGLPLGLSATYYDEVVITGSNSGIPVADPTLSYLPSISPYYDITGNTASATVSFLMGDNSASTSTEQNGTVIVDFGTNILTQISIRYRNNSSATTDPAPQAIAIGNISFQKENLLPVKLTSFDYTKLNQSLLLRWQSADELNVKEYIVEKSYDGTNFTAVGTVPSQNFNKNYTYTDNAAAKPTVFYRLKTVDYNGSYTYSNILVAKEKNTGDDKITVFPNPVINNSANIFMPKILINKPVLIKVIGQDGRVILQQQNVVYTNTINIDLPKHLHGVAIIEVQHATDKNILYREKVLVK
ncbi:MAG: hypothetical protein WDM90_06985 [Ferruginibacter sp.]